MHRQAGAQIWGRPRGRSGFDFELFQICRHLTARNARVGAAPENPGKKLLIAGHTDKQGDTQNQPLSEHRAAAVQALIEGKRIDYIKACNSSHSEVDVTQLFDWAHQPPFNFTCKPTTLTAAPSDENYVKFRKSFNAWSDSNGGNPIKLQGRLNDDIWSAMFDLYEYNLKDELGEDPAGLRGKVDWVDSNKKSMGFGEKHPNDPNAVDGKANPADRRVEALLFNDDEETLPKLAETNGEDVYDGVTYDKILIPAMASAKRALFRVRLHDDTRTPMLAGTPYRLTIGNTASPTLQAEHDGWVPVKLPTDQCPDNVLLEWGDPNSFGAFSFAVSLYVDCNSGDDNAKARARLNNLGYSVPTQESLESAVIQFQLDYGISERGLSSGQLPDQTKAKLSAIYETNCDARASNQQPS